MGPESKWTLVNERQLEEYIGEVVLGRSLVCPPLAVVHFDFSLKKKK